jgi:hypothetical protein
MSAPRSIDLVIVMDVTGSMGTWIAAAKDTAIKIAEETRANFPDVSFRLGYIGYRDYGDKERFVHAPLTPDIASVRAVVAGVSADGGNDAPEDVAGGLAEAAKEVYTADVKSLILVADAPCHGKAFHHLSDRYPDGDPGGLDPLAQIRDFATKGFDITFVRCNNSTDKMIEAFSSAFDAAKASEEQSFSVQDLSGVQAPHLLPSSAPGFSAAAFASGGGGGARAHFAAAPPSAASSEAFLSSCTASVSRSVMARTPRKKDG